MKTYFNINKITGKINIKTILSFAFLLAFSFPTFAQEKAAKIDTPSVFSNPVFLSLATMIILLMIIIIVFTDLVNAAAHYRNELEKSKKDNPSIVIKTILLFIALGGFTNSSFAQTNVAAPMPSQIPYWGLGSTLFYTLIAVIIVELVAVIVLYSISLELLGSKERKVQEAAEKEKIKATVIEPSIIDKFNASVAIEREADILLDHNYDGIQELDNNLPPWWKYGFYLTIVVGIIYLINFHVLKTGKLQEAEYNDQIAQAKIELEEYKKKALDLVDENNVAMLTDASSIDAGKTIYIENCAACHGKGGEGTVGPNLTDDYWMHKGGIKDIFKTIKFGYPEKGMKAWQQDLSAKQINQVSSFIKSIYGTNPANPKEKQGELYKEETANDSLNVAPKDSAQAEPTTK